MALVMSKGEEKTSEKHKKRQSQKMYFVEFTTILERMDYFLD